jgi:hypothetical protein
MVRGAADVADAALFELLLETTLASPRHKLPSVVREDLAGPTPLADGALDHLHDCIPGLLPEEPVTHDVAGVVVDDPDQVDRVHPLELEGKDVDLPKRIWDRPLETPHLDRTAFGLHR